LIAGFISTLEASFARVLAGRTLLEILVIVFVCRILIFMHMAIGDLRDGAVHVIVLSAHIYSRSGDIAVFVYMPVVKRGLPIHMMNVAGFIGIAACRPFVGMPVPVVDRRFAQVVM
jgi:hypothetical protein